MVELLYKYLFDSRIFILLVLFPTVHITFVCSIIVFMETDSVNVSFVFTKNIARKGRQLF